MVGGAEFIDIRESLNRLSGTDLNTGGAEFIERWDICPVVDLNTESGGSKERRDVWFCFSLVSGVDFRDVWGGQEVSLAGACRSVDLDC